MPWAQADEATWVTVEGTTEMTAAEDAGARGRAIADAKRKAVQKAVGVDITAETLLVNFRLSGSLVGAIPYGRVVDSEIIQEAVDSSHQQGQDPATSTYRVKMKASVAEETEGGDPSFRLEAYLNRI